jgi:hypothetical protein
MLSMAARIVRTAHWKQITGTHLELPQSAGCPSFHLAFSLSVREYFVVESVCEARGSFHEVASSALRNVGARMKMTLRNLRKFKNLGQLKKPGTYNNTI